MTFDAFSSYFQSDSLPVIVSVFRGLYLVTAALMIWKVRPSLRALFTPERAPADFVFATLAGISLGAVIFQGRYFLTGVGDNNSWLTLFALGTCTLALFAGLFVVDAVIENLRPWREFRPYMPILRLFADLGPLDPTLLEELAQTASKRTLEVLSGMDGDENKPEDVVKAMGTSLSEAARAVIDDRACGGPKDAGD